MIGRFGTKVPVSYGEPGAICVQETDQPTYQANTTDGDERKDAVQKYFNETRNPGTPEKDFDEIS